MKDFIKKILQFVFQNIADRKVRYVTCKEKIVRHYKNRKLKYHLLTKDEVLFNKKSDTIFILATGSSINNITSEQWNIIRQNDSFGFNYCFLHWFIPTFYMAEYSRYRQMREKFIEIFNQKERNIRYSPVVIFVSSRARKMGAHPTYTPELFPIEPKIFYFPHPKVLSVPHTRIFRGSDFKDFSFKLGEKNIIYRGTLSVVLSIACQLGYRNIVLLGVDLKDGRNFYSDYDEMKWIRDPNIADEVYSIDSLHATMRPKGGKHPISEYIYALNEYCLIPNGINLYIGHKESLLSEGLRLYPWSENKSL